MSFAENLKKYRVAGGYIQQDLADYLSLDRSSIAHYEQGNVEPSLGVLIKLCELFKVTPNDLLGYVRQ